jgi:Fe-S-cluster containining protein
MQIAIDFSLDNDKYEEQIDNMMDMVIANKLAITIPMPMNKGKEAIITIASIVSQVNCSDCSAKCCRSGHNNIIVLQEHDVSRLNKIDGGKHIRYSPTSQSGAVLSYPCPYLKGNNCSIYDKRPSVCSVYPVQPATGGFVALDASCPKSKIIGKRIYMAIYAIIHMSEDR